MKLVVGLGNPGHRYEKTPHNLGFRVLDELAKNKDVKFKEDKSHKAEIAEIGIGSEKILLVKPQTMMNLSGQAVRSLAHFYKVENPDILIVSDDFNLPFGQLRIRHGGEHGGHNGLGSVISSIGEDFWRFRIGVASGHLDKSDHSTFVTAPFAPEQMRQLTHLLDRAAELLEEYLEKGTLGHDTIRLV